MQNGLIDFARLLFSTLRNFALLPGRKHDAAGFVGSDATIGPRHQHNLAGMGLAGHENVKAEPEFARFVEHIKNEIRGS